MLETLTSKLIKSALSLAFVPLAFASIVICVADVRRMDLFARVNGTGGRVVG